MDEGFDRDFDRRAESISFFQREPFAERWIVGDESDEDFPAGEKEFHILVGIWGVLLVELIDECGAGIGIRLKLIVLEQEYHLVEAPENQSERELAVVRELKPDMILQGAFPLGDKAEFPFLKEAEHLPSHADI